ncbi:MAG: hydrolase [Candidatus Saccharibacteria bacterium]|nr:hydrolase [Candidatus Saccharibacteria bacterium]
MVTVISKDGTKIAYSVTGNGPAIILVDGAFCYRDNGPSAKLSPLLSEHFTVYTYDRRGRGESSDTVPYTIDREIEDLNALRAIIDEPAYVVGMSSGGALVINAILRGVTFNKVALFEVPYVAASSPNAIPPIDAISELNQRIEAGKRSDAVKYFMTKVFGAPEFFIFIMKYAMRSSWMKNEIVAHTLPYDLQLMADWNVPSGASTLNIPTLVLSGEKAPKKLRDATIALANTLPSSKHEILAKQSHNVSADILARALTKFFLEQV